jgi:CheY-like chemotaxis protein
MHTVLVVEDEPIIRLGAVAIVEDAGFVALEAADAAEAIRILETRDDIRLIFTDVDMPGTMDGLKLANYVRNRWPPIKIIVASGKAIVDEGSLPSGAELFAKPYEQHLIAAAIRRMVAIGSYRTE